MQKRIRPLRESELRDCAGRLGCRDGTIVQPRPLHANRDRPAADPGRQPMSKQRCGQWQRFGDLVYGAGKGAFETSWP